MIETDIKKRLAWVDATRALCVVAVVLLHVQGLVFGPTNTEYPNEMLGWNSVTSFLGSFRMPGLFAVSGFLVASRVRRGWSDRQNGVRVASSLYLYVIWWAILSLCLAWHNWNSEFILKFFTQFFAAFSVMWFVFFLAINVIVLTTLHRVHPAIILGSLAALSALMLAIDPVAPWANWVLGAYCMFFFALGVYLPSLMSNFVSSGLWWKIPLVLIVLVVLIEGFRGAPFRSTAWIGLSIMRDTAAVFTAIAVAAALCLIRPVAIALSYLGRRTLIIYVAHMPLVLLAINIRDGVAGQTFDLRLAWVIGPGIVTLAIVVACLLLGNLLSRSRVGRGFLDLPPSLRDVILGKRKPGEETIEDLENTFSKLPGVESIRIHRSAEMVLSQDITDSQLKTVVEALRGLDLRSLSVDVKLPGQIAPSRVLTLEAGSANTSVPKEQLALNMRERVLSLWS